MAHFAQKYFAGIFDCHLEFLCKMQKHIYLGNTLIQSDFGEIFNSGGTHSHLALCVNNCLPAIFGGHLEFLCKKYKCIYPGNSARIDFDEIFDKQ